MKPHLYDTKPYLSIRNLIIGWGTPTPSPPASPVGNAFSLRLSRPLPPGRSPSSHTQTSTFGQEAKAEGRGCWIEVDSVWMAGLRVDWFRHLRTKDAHCGLGDFSEASREPQKSRDLKRHMNLIMCAERSASIFSDSCASSNHVIFEALERLR